MEYGDLTKSSYTNSSLSFFPKTFAAFLRVNNVTDPFSGSRSLLTAAREVSSRVAKEECPKNRLTGIGFRC
jgi:hypothetical protein